MCLQGADAVREQVEFALWIPTTRRRALVQAGIAITSELSLDAVLQTLVRIAADLTGARYSALGVIDRTGTSLARFVTHGVDDATRAAIGDLPRGRGILGVLISDARPLRLDDLSRDPRSVGFPPITRRCTASSAFP